MRIRGRRRRRRPQRRPGRRRTGVLRGTGDRRAGIGNEDEDEEAPKKGPDHLNLYALGFDATWEVDLFGGARRIVEQARAQAEASEWMRRDGQVSLVAEFVNDYVTLRAAQTRIANGVAERDRQRQLFGADPRPPLAGFVTEVDVNQQSVQVETAAAQLPQLRAQEAAQRHAVAVLVAREAEALQDRLRPDGRPPPGPPPVLGLDLPSDLLRRRRDVREAEHRPAAANAGIGVQVAKLFPSLNFCRPGLVRLHRGGQSALEPEPSVDHPGIGEPADIQRGPDPGGDRRRQGGKDPGPPRLGRGRAHRVPGCGGRARPVPGGQREERFSHPATRTSESSLLVAQAQYTAGLTPFLSVLQAENAVLNSRDQLARSDAQRLGDLASLKALGGGYDPAAPRRPGA